MGRGYSAAILNKFDVGYCHDTNRSYFDRVITPFYDDNGEYMVGYTGRNRYALCKQCNLYHNPNVRCPITKQDKAGCSKWKHGSGFSVESYLYNFWNAKQHIENTNVAILVEGPGDVWRIEEAGIYTSLALLGAKLSPGQKYILETSGTIDLIIATDNDEAGNKAARSITNECSALFNIHRLEYPTHDPGKMNVEQVKEALLPILERL